MLAKINERPDTGEREERRKKSWCGGERRGKEGEERDGKSISDPGWFGWIMT